MIREEIPAIFQDALSQLPTLHVNIFACELKTRTYLQVSRQDRPTDTTEWLVGGPIQKGESLFAAAQRCCAEAGLVLKSLTLLGLHHLRFRRDDRDVHAVEVNFFANIEYADDDILQSLFDDYAWTSLDLLPKDRSVCSVRHQAVRALQEQITMPASMSGEYNYHGDGQLTKVDQIPKALYQSIVQGLPIFCVDILLLNKTLTAFLSVFRKDPPAQRVWWLIGGRCNLNETVEECAKRKCLQEVGLNIHNIKLLGFRGTLFPNSMWGTQTHTMNVIVSANIADDTSPIIDPTCEQLRWIPIDSKGHKDPYVDLALQFFRASRT